MKVAVVVVVALGLAGPAAAFPSMIRHGYASCQACHVDPSGGGQLSAYGRAQSDLLVGWHLEPSVIAEGEASPTTGFLFGLVPLPEQLNLSGNLRGGGLYNMSSTGEGAGARPLLMAADAAASVQVEWFLAHLTLGFANKNVGPAAVVSVNSGPDNALVSREHWLGVRLVDDALTIRAGRIPLPFGLRNNEHTSLVRDLTRTDINVDQQHGLALAWNGEGLRAELMGIAGNYQVRPDAFRDRGYAGFVEWTPATTLAIGASSLMAWTEKDLDVGLPLWRQSHGVFARYAPIKSVAILGEADLIANVASSTAYGIGGAGWLQIDVEPIQGVHVAPAFELAKADATTQYATSGGWVTLSWYPLPHTELRGDVAWRRAFPSSSSPASPVGTFTALLQLHLFL
ncbi:MAG: hypothetical protein Q8O67_01690 [Deltaproteobacteria bacterium]|nr:hypothetical protein [Deltaproteobacteria bacterium]